MNLNIKNVNYRSRRIKQKKREPKKNYKKIISQSEYYPGFMYTDWYLPSQYDGGPLFIRKMRKRRSKSKKTKEV